MAKRKIQIQQGDVIVEAAAIPANVKRLAHRVLREGEHTGHKHVALLDEPQVESGADVALFIDEATQTLYMRVFGGAARVVHEEHNPVTIPEGEYRIGAVQEYDYDAEEARNVMD